MSSLESEQRIRRLIDAGGVDLSALREDAALRSSIRIGTFETGMKFRFRCPICGNTVVNDQEMEPVCTGPHPSLDEHPHEPMVRVP